MSHQLPANAVLAQSPRSHTEELKVIVQNEFVRSFDGFTTSWRGNCVFGFPQTIIPKVRANISLFDRADREDFLYWILGYVESNFVNRQVAALLEVRRTDDEFFSLLLAVMDYLKEVFRVLAELLNVDTTAWEYQLLFGNCDVLTNLVKKSTQMLSRTYGDRIMSSIRRSVRFLRINHSYHDSMFWNSISETSLGKIVQLLDRVHDIFAPETQRYNAFVQQYELELLEDVTAYVNKIPLRISETRFLITMRECVDVESHVYSTLISLDIEMYDECNQKILDMFRDKHAERRSALIFTDHDFDLVNPDVQFSAEYFRDLFALYVFRGNKIISTTLDKLSTMIRESLVDVMQTQTGLPGVLTPGRQALKFFKPALRELCRRAIVIRKRLKQISGNEELIKALDRTAAELCLCSLGNVSCLEQLREANKYAISFLCDSDMTGDEESSLLTFVIIYYWFIPQRTMFMNDLYLEMRMKALQRIPLPIVRLKLFTSRVSTKAKIPRKVQCLIRDLNMNLGVGGNDSTGFIDAGMKCDVSLSARARYWNSEKDQSKFLQPSAAVAGLHERVTKYLETKIDKDRELVPMHCLSRIVLKTTLFTRGRAFTRLEMLQHQAMILQRCEEKGPIRMSEIVKLLIKRDTGTDSDRTKAERFIGLLVESLTRPYPMIIITRGVENNPNDAIVTINHDFVFEEQEVRVPGDYLVLDVGDHL